MAVMFVSDVKAEYMNFTEVLAAAIIYKMLTEFEARQLAQRELVGWEEEQQLLEASYEQIHRGMAREEHLLENGPDDRTRTITETIHTAIRQRSTISNSEE